MMVSETALRNRLGHYLANQIPLDDLTESVVDAAWDIGPDQDDAESRFASAVQLTLAELSDGLVSPDAFRSFLAQLLKDFTETHRDCALVSWLAMAAWS